MRHEMTLTVSTTNATQAATVRAVLQSLAELLEGEVGTLLTVEFTTNTEAP